MNFQLNKKNGTVKIFNNDIELLAVNVSRKIAEQEIHEKSIAQNLNWSDSNRDLLKVIKIKNGWRLTLNNGSGYREWLAKFELNPIIFPTREGEYISNPKKIHNYSSYSLSYPGTASTKVIVVFFSDNSGILFGSSPSLDYAYITLNRFEDKFLLRIFQNSNKLEVYPFEEDWRIAADRFRENNLDKSIIQNKSNSFFRMKRLFLQMGVRDFYGKTTLKSFDDLIPLIDRFYDKVGKGHIIHLFGTNQAGFDKMFPDFSIDKSLGGKSKLKKVVNHIHEIGLYASHHFNPRIADYNWLEQNPKFNKCVVNHPSGNPWVEFYKNNVYFTMNPNDDLWLDFCTKQIKYLKSMGFDYLELDQIAYQRNLYTKEKGLGPGYQKLINRTKKEGVKFWLEGVSDIYRLPKDCYFQILPRGRSQLWETDENRCGYPYGTAYTTFFRRLLPDIPASYQIVTEKAKVNLIGKRMKLAEKLNIQVYDLELGFIDKTYEQRLRKTLKKLTPYIDQFEHE